MITVRKNEVHRKRDHSCGSQRWGVGKGELVEGGQKVRTSNYKNQKLLRLWLMLLYDM